MKTSKKAPTSTGALQDESDDTFVDFGHVLTPSRSDLDLLGFQERRRCEPRESGGTQTRA